MIGQDQPRLGIPVVAISLRHDAAAMSRLK